MPVVAAAVVAPQPPSKSASRFERSPISKSPRRKPGAFYRNRFRDLLRGTPRLYPLTRSSDQFSEGFSARSITHTSN
jgi:hypothetical protein